MTLALLLVLLVLALLVVLLAFVFVLAFVAALAFEAGFALAFTCLGRPLSSASIMIEGACFALAFASLVAAGLMAVSNEGESGTGSECHQQSMQPAEWGRVLLWRHLPVIETVREEKRGALSKIERAGVVRCRTVKGILRPVGFMEIHGSNFGSSLWKELCLFRQQP